MGREGRESAQRRNRRFCFSSSTHRRNQHENPKSVQNHGPCPAAGGGLLAAGRYGWRLWGFAACQSAGIETVEVSESAVHITGFYPGSFPSGFCGYYALERDGELYVGFRFGDIAGFFETGDFDIMIPVKGDISRVVMKSSQAETELWNRDAGFVLQ